MKNKKQLNDSSERNMELLSIANENNEDSNLVIGLYSSEKGPKMLEYYAHKLCPTTDLELLDSKNDFETVHGILKALKTVTDYHKYCEIADIFTHDEINNYFVEAKKKSFSKSRKVKRAKLLRGKTLDGYSPEIIQDFLKTLECKHKFANKNAWLKGVGLWHEHIILLIEESHDDILGSLEDPLFKYVELGLVEIHCLRSIDSDTIETKFLANQEVAQKYLESGLEISMKSFTA